MAVTRNRPVTTLENNFAIYVDGNDKSTFTLDRVYPAGTYSVSSVNGDNTYDIYAVAGNGSYAGYTNTSRLVAAKRFRKVVVMGVTEGEKLLFTYQGTVTTRSGSGDIPGASPFLTSISESSLPEIDDFTTVAGGNFAPNVEFFFKGTDEEELEAKSVTNFSTTEAVVVRPDDLLVEHSPYSLIARNPGVPDPATTSAHILEEAITAGTSPSWQSDASYVYNITGSTADITLLATDTEESEMTYSIVTGSLPSGFSLNSSTGVISGTFSGSAVDGDSNVVAFRATDAGSNYTNKDVTFFANAAPTWTTSALPEGANGNAYSFQLEASGGTVGTTLAFSLVSGSLPGGVSLSSGGLLSGTNTDSNGTTKTFTLRVSDQYGLSADREFSILTDQQYVPGTFNETFDFTGQRVTWARPDNGLGTITMTVTAQGGSGGKNGGLGAQVVATIPNSLVTNTMYFRVGGKGSDETTNQQPQAGGFNGGGSSGTGGNGGGGAGGGATDVRSSGDNLSDRLVVAGGGGGTGGWSGGGGGGGSHPNGVSGTSGQGGGGQGGTQTAGGSPGSSNGGFVGSAGSFGQGGTGGGSGTAGGGGGGGGYYGGGGGGADTDSCCSDGGGGGGGSSYAHPNASSVTHTPAVRNGNGSLSITYTIV
jgi:hypothetical protein